PPVARSRRPPVARSRRPPVAQSSRAPAARPPAARLPPPPHRRTPLPRPSRHHLAFRRTSQIVDSRLRHLTDLGHANRDDTGLIITTIREECGPGGGRRRSDLVQDGFSAVHVADRARLRAYVARARPDQAAGLLLPQDVGEPAGGPRAGE